MPKEAEVAPLKPQPSLVVERVRNLKVISNRLFRLTVAFLPIGIGVLLLADWLIGTQAFSSDVFRLSGVITVAIELFILDQLFRRLPEALESIWIRDLLFSSNTGEQHDQKFIQFVNVLETALNSRWAVAIGVLGAILGISATYPVRFFFQTGVFPYDSNGLLTYYLWGNGAFVAAPLGYILGLLAWRVSLIAIYIDKLGQNFEIRVQPNHPDQCGGLKPLGDLCLFIALLVLMPAIFFSVWGFATTFFQTGGGIYNQLWSGLLRQWLVLLIVLALVAFLWPLYSIHTQMQKQRREIQAELDNLAERINELSTELRTEAYKLTPEQGEEKLKSLEFMRRVYQESARIPVWPIDWQTLLKFSGAQAVPILSLLGTSESIIKIVESLMASTTK